ncbi:MAG: class I SAM-dependent methyltransferase [Candidatus Latescibacterota bacterium]
MSSLRPAHWGEAEIRGPVHLFRERLVLRRFRELVPGGLVLDAGCGSGSLAVDLGRAGYEVEAVEQSPEFVERVAARVRGLGLEARLRVRQGSVTELPWPEATFDGVVCGEVLEHLGPETGGDLAAVRGFHRVLRPAGGCVVSVPLSPRLWDHCDEWAGHMKRYERGELIDLFERVGFQVLGTRSWGFPLGRLYHRLVFAPWVRRTGGQAVAAREGRWDTRAGRHPVAAALVAGLLRFDELFGRWPWGRGIVLWARKV